MFPPGRARLATRPVATVPPREVERRRPENSRTYWLVGRIGWGRGVSNRRTVERLHRLSQLRAAVETTGTVSAIAAKKNGPQLSRCQSATRTVRLGAHVQSGTRLVAQKIRGNHSAP